MAAAGGASAIERSLRSGVHRVGGLAGNRVQSLRGVAGDYVTEDDLFSEEFIGYEIEQIKAYLEDSLVQFLYIVSGLTGTSLNVMVQPGANMLKLEGSVLSEARQFAPDAVRDFELSKMYSTNKRLRTLVGEPVATGIPAAPPTQVPAPATAQSILLREAVLSIAPLGAPFAPSDKTAVSEALGEMNAAILKDGVRVFDVVGNPINNGNTPQEHIDTMNRMRMLYDAEVRAIRNKERQAFSLAMGRYHLVWDTVVKQNLFPSLSGRDMFISIYGGSVQETLKTMTEGASRQIPNPALSVPANVPPVRAAQLGIGEPMDKLTYAEALKWLIENKPNPSETDIEILKTLYAQKPTNHPDWMLMPHHSKHIFLAPNVGAAIKMCVDEVQERCPALNLTSQLLIENESLKNKFADLVAAYIKWKQTGVSSFTSVHSSNWLFYEYTTALEKFRRLVSTAPGVYSFVAPPPEPESRARRIMRQLGS